MRACVVAMVFTKRWTFEFARASFASQDDLLKSGEYNFPAYADNFTNSNCWHS